MSPNLLRALDTADGNKYVCTKDNHPGEDSRCVLADRTATQYDRLLASSCCPSICPSVCDAVHSGSQGWCTRLKVTPACSEHVPICPLRHFFCRMYRLATKCTTKIESKKHVCVLVYIHYLLFRRAWPNFVVTRQPRWLARYTVRRVRCATRRTRVTLGGRRLGICRVRSETGTVRSDFSFPAAHGLEIVTTGLIVRQ